MKKLLVFILLSLSVVAHAQWNGGVTIKGSAQLKGTPLWVYDNGIAWSNRDEACYEAQNVVNQLGTFILTTKYQPISCFCAACSPESESLNYTTANIYATPLFTYGAFEATVALAGGENHSAFWLLNSDCFLPGNTCSANEPEYREVDIAEVYNDSSYTLIHQNIFGPAVWALQGTTTVADWRNSNLFRFEWTAGSMVFKVNGTVTNTFQSAGLDWAQKPMILFFSSLADTQLLLAADYPITMTFEHIKHYPLNPDGSCCQTKADFAQ